VRKALFDILGDIAGLSFLELFSGSGAVGLEAASRQAAEVVLVEHNRGCIAALKENIRLLKTRACSVHPQEAGQAIKDFHRQGRIFDIVFMDPPYYKPVPWHVRPGSKSRSPDTQVTKKTLQMLSVYDIVTPNGFLIVQHFKKDSLPEVAGDFILCKHFSYGDTLLSFYKHA
jgi:16S rRNA (guanine966-N2)-methyltransferase